MVPHAESDVRHAGIDPALHYLAHGAQEGRNPTPHFDTNWYLSRYPDVRAAGVNPLVHYLRHSAAEARHPSPKAEVAARKQKLLAAMTRNDKILEIGPSFSPIAPKSEGWNSFSLDHASMDELKEKYQAYANLDVSKIEPVDFVWKQGPMELAVPSQHLGTFVACIASHVLEHVPNLVGFFQSAAQLLCPNGVLSLALPDKRYCFDYFQSLTDTADILEAHAECRSRHTRSTLYRSAAYNVKAGDAIAWSQWPRWPVQNLVFAQPDPGMAKLTFDQHDQSEMAPYIDSHCWYFTPASFELAILELGYLGLIDFSIERVLPLDGCEFHVTLRRGAPSFPSVSELADHRLFLLKRIIREVSEQADLLV